MYTVHIVIVHCILHCTMYSVHIVIVHCIPTLYNVHYTMYNVQCTMYACMYKAMNRESMFNYNFVGCHVVNTLINYSSIKRINSTHHLNVVVITRV